MASFNPCDLSCGACSTGSTSISSGDENESAGPTGAAQNLKGPSYQIYLKSSSASSHLISVTVTTTTTTTTPPPLSSSSTSASSPPCPHEKHQWHRLQFAPHLFPLWTPPPHVVRWAQLSPPAPHFGTKPLPSHPPPPSPGHRPQRMPCPRHFGRRAQLRHLANLRRVIRTESQPPPPLSAALDEAQGSGEDWSYEQAINLGVEIALYEMSKYGVNSISSRFIFDSKLLVHLQAMATCSNSGKFCPGQTVRAKKLGNVVNPIINRPPNRHTWVATLIPKR